MVALKRAGDFFFLNFFFLFVFFLGLFLWSFGVVLGGGGFMIVQMFWPSHSRNSRIFLEEWPSFCFCAVANVVSLRPSSSS